MKSGFVRAAWAAGDEFSQTAQPIAPLLAVATQRVTLTGSQLRRASHPVTVGDCPVKVKVGIGAAAVTVSDPASTLRIIGTTNICVIEK